MLQDPQYSHSVHWAQACPCVIWPACARRLTARPKNTAPNLTCARLSATWGSARPCLGAQRHLHCIGKLVHAGQHCGAAVHAKAHFLCSIATRCLQLCKRLHAAAALCSRRRFTCRMCKSSHRRQETRCCAFICAAPLHSAAISTGDVSTDCAKIMIIMQCDKPQWRRRISSRKHPHRLYCHSKSSRLQTMLHAWQ